MSSAVGAVSPHLDDAALSCSLHLAAHPGSLVVTVFAGGPVSVDPLPAWDNASGTFVPGADVVRARRAEDVLALAALGASGHHLDHWDAQYRIAAYGYSGPRDPGALTRAVASDLESFVSTSSFDTWLIPLGLVHADHKVTAKACLMVASTRPDIDWLVYEELPYAAGMPQDVPRALSELNADGLDLVPAHDVGAVADRTVKRAAVESYTSQLRPLGGGTDLAIETPELLRHLVGL